MKISPFNQQLMHTADLNVIGLPDDLAYVSNDSHITRRFGFVILIKDLIIQVQTNICMDELLQITPVTC